MKILSGIAAAALFIGVGEASPRHIELLSSQPAAGTVLTAPPTELVLTFSAELDFERSAVTMRGPSGSAVELGEPQAMEDPRQMTVDIVSQLGSGSYLVSWTAAPKDDHGGRGRFRFEVQ